MGQWSVIEWCWLVGVLVSMYSQYTSAAWRLDDDDDDDDRSIDVLAFFVFFVGFCMYPFESGTTILWRYHFQYETCPVSYLLFLPFGMSLTCSAILLLCRWSVLAAYRGSRFYSTPSVDFRVRWFLQKMVPHYANMYAWIFCAIFSVWWVCFCYCEIMIDIHGRLFFYSVFFDYGGKKVYYFLCSDVFLSCSK